MGSTKSSLLAVGSPSWGSRAGGVGETGLMCAARRVEEREGAMGLAPLQFLKGTGSGWSPTLPNFSVGV